MGVAPIFIGSNNSDHTRDNASELANCNCPVFIASSTDKHYTDLVQSLTLNPKMVFVEKGFKTTFQKEQARTLIKDIPVYILSQYRYSNVFDHVSGNIISCEYDWTIEKGEISEWAHHIISIDNYIKKTNNQLDIMFPGDYILDDISKLSIKYGNERKLKIDIETDEHQFNIILGKTSNIIYNGETTLEFNEDCLEKQIIDVLHNTKNTKLERL